MSVIQKIRDKYARWAVIAIAVSLLGFILMDAFAGRTGLFSNKQTNTIGKVNGHTINRLDFEQKIQNQERTEQAQGYPVDDNRRQQIMQTVWDQEVNDVILNEEYEKLGLTVTDKELRDMLYGANPPQELKQQFTDQKTGQFNATAAQQYINSARKDPTRKDQIDKYFEYLKSQRLMGKYMSLLTNTIYFPKWFLEKRNVDNSLMGKISYVSVPYATIADSAVKVTDEEIRSYVNDHKDEFEQKDETRSISYVLFNAAPNASDSGAIKNQVLALKGPFASATDAGTFINQQGSETPYEDIYQSKSSIPAAAKDSIVNLPKGGLYGPYLDGPNYVIAKMIDSRILPDSVKARHILLGTVNPQTGQPIMSDSVAKAKADSIALAIKNGASFDLLDSLYSTDEAAKKDKGVMTFPSAIIQGPNFAKEFGQFILFDGKPGDKKVLKTQFGWHYIEIMEHKNPQLQYKVAYLAKPVYASPETDQQAHNQANLFAGDSRDINSFNSNFDKNLRPKGISKLVAIDIDAMAYNIQGLQGNARSFVKKIFEADKGDVISPERVGDNYVVAVVTDVTEPGVQSVNSVRPRVEPILRNKKKGEQIKKNIGQVTTLEQVAGKVGQNIQTIDSLRFSGGPNLGYEPKILGASFNPANKGKVVNEPIAGTSGVFVLRVDNTTTTPVEAANIEEQQRMLDMQSRQSLMQQMQQGYNPIIEVLKRAATIKDNRSKFF